MVSGGRGASVTFWAWTASIAVHLIVLTAFGFVKFSQSKAQAKQRPAPTAKVTHIKKLMQAAPIIPKPKIKRPLPVTGSSRFVRVTDRELVANRIFDTAKPGLQSSAPCWDGLAKSAWSTGVFSLPSSAISPSGIEFFGSWTDQRKVCYLVDCSGSMHGVFGRVREELAESIASLQPDHYFYIIFFGGGRLFEFGDGRLLRATPDAKSAAYDFIDSVQPAGQTNAMTAMERAVQICDGSGFSPSIIYFLTDGFELTTEDTHQFIRKITNLLERFAPTTRINTIGFWPQTEDCKMLKIIAKQSGGEFVFVRDGGS